MTFEEDAELIQRFFISIYKFLGESADDYKYKIHVSDLIYDCMRKAYYWKIHPPVIDIKSAMRMAIGKAIHEIPFFSSTGHELEVEMDGIYGHIDEYLEDFKMIIDKKTCRSIPREPYPHHVKQVEMYGVMLTEKGYDVEKLGVIYIDVVSPDVKAYSWTPMFDPQLLKEEMLLKRDILLEALKTGVPPPRHVSWECYYCPFANQCFSEG